MDIDFLRNNYSYTTSAYYSLLDPSVNGVYKHYLNKQFTCFALENNIIAMHYKFHVLSHCLYRI